MNESIPTHEAKVDVRISALKPLHATWIMEFYDYIRSKPDIINGWNKSGITKAIRKPQADKGRPS